MNTWFLFLSGIFWGLVLGVMYLWNTILRRRIRDALSTCESIQELASHVPAGGRISVHLLAYEVSLIEAKLKGTSVPDYDHPVTRLYPKDTA